jgi:hypothetical protein
MATELEELQTDIVEQTDFPGDVRLNEDKDQLRVVDHTTLDLYITFGDRMRYDVNGSVGDTEVKFEGLSSNEVLHKLDGNLFE